MTAVTVTMTPVGKVHNGRIDTQDSDRWGDVNSTILVDQTFGDRSFTGLDGFSHVEVVFFVPDHIRQPAWADRLMADYFNDGSRSSVVGAGRP